MKRKLHIVCTRFNIPVAGVEKEMDRKWLESRYNIFKITALPTMKGQTNKEFIWNIYFSEDTPEDFLDAIRNDVKGINYSIIKLPKSEIMVKNLRRKNYSEYDYIITSRLDTDDCLRFDYVDFVNKNIHLMKAPFILNFTTGYLYDLKNKEYYIFRWPHGSNTMSMVEKTTDGEISTVHFISHIKILNYKPHRNIIRPYFITTIHDLNSFERVRGIKTKMINKDLYPPIEQ